MDIVDRLKNKLLIVIIIIIQKNHSFDLSVMFQNEYLICKYDNTSKYLK